jgi:ATP-binding cassette subfamily B protein
MSGGRTIDGIDVRDHRPSRRQIGIVLQDTFLFSASVIDNVRFGRPGHRRDVRSAIRLANADTFIERLPNKYGRSWRARSGLRRGKAAAFHRLGGACDLSHLISEAASVDTAPSA